MCWKYLSWWNWKNSLGKKIFNITKSLGKNPAFIKKYYDYLSDEIKMLKNSGQTYQDRKRYKIYCWLSLTIICCNLR